MLGLNIEVTFIRNTYVSDDNVGGAIITGSVVYSGIAARLSARRPSQVSLDSGLEVERTFDMIVNGQSLTLFERDEVQVTSPLNSPYYGEEFRILGLQHDSRRPGRGSLAADVGKPAV